MMKTENLTMVREWDKTFPQSDRVDHSKVTFVKLVGYNKQMLTVKGASHTDLYDRLDVIPFDEIGAFFTKYFTEE